MLILLTFLLIPEFSLSRSRLKDVPFNFMVLLKVQLRWLTFSLNNPGFATLGIGTLSQLVVRVG
jgi:hypothetical protein